MNAVLEILALVARRNQHGRAEHVGLWQHAALHGAPVRIPNHETLRIKAVDLAIGHWVAGLHNKTPGGHALVDRSKVLFGQLAAGGNQKFHRQQCLVGNAVLHQADEFVEGVILCNGADVGNEIPREALQLRPHFVSEHEVDLGVPARLELCRRDGPERSRRGKNDLVGQRANDAAHHGNGRNTHRL